MYYIITSQILQLSQDGMGSYPNPMEGQVFSSKRRLSYTLLYNAFSDVILYTCILQYFWLKIISVSSCSDDLAQLQLHLDLVRDMRI